MDSVKIVATPEAYELLASLSEGEETKSAVSAAFWLFAQEHKSSDCFIENCPIALAAYWAKSPTEESIIMLDKHDGHQLFYFLDDYKLFFEKLKNALPISLV